MTLRANLERKKLSQHDDLESWPWRSNSADLEGENVRGDLEGEVNTVTLRADLDEQSKVGAGKVDVALGCEQVSNELDECHEEIIVISTVISRRGEEAEF